MPASAPVAGVAAMSGHPTIGVGAQASRRGRPCRVGCKVWGASERITCRVILRRLPLWLWHRPIGGNGNLDGRAAIEAIVAVQCGDGVGHAFEWELVRDHVLQRQAL